MYLLTNGRVITRDEGGKGYYEKGAVAYEGTRIVEVGEEAALRAKYPQAEIIDAKGGVIMPAFINAHTHIYSALARGLSIVGNNPTNFYEVLDGTWWAMDRKLTLEGSRASADALYIDCIKQGVTTIFDHHAAYCEIPGSLFQIGESAKKFAPACATRSPTATAKRSACRPSRRTPTGSPTVRKRRIRCSPPCSAATPCSPSPTRRLTAWSRPTTAAPAIISMSPRA